MKNEKVSATVVTAQGSFTVDDYESFNKENDQQLWKEFDSWYDKAFYPYADLWNHCDVLFEHQFNMSKRDMTIYFFNDSKLIEQISKSYPNVKIPIIGFVQITSEWKIETCVAPIFQHSKCDVNWLGDKQDLNDVSKMITSLVLTSSDGSAPKCLPSVLIHNLKCWYMEVAEGKEVRGVYSVLD